MEVVLPNGSLFIRKSNLSTPKRRRFRLSAEIEEIRVCTNRTCRRQGSFQTLEILTSLAPANVAVKSSGCLGRCGSGPNLVALPGAVMVNHCGTAARAAEVMMALCKGDWDSDAAQKSLEALALRKKAESELEKGNFSEAEFLLSKNLYKNLSVLPITFRAVARLTMDKYSEALEDIREALALFPKYSEAYICQGDAFLAMNQFDLAEKSYSTALEINKSIRRSKSFKARIAKLQEKIASVNTP